jgi:putative oxidoreductase
MRRLLVALARILLSGIFVVAGWEAFREPGGRPKQAAKLGFSDPELAVRANGLGMVLAGSTLGLGIKPKVSALALMGLLVPTTLAGHAFWEEDEPQAVARQRVQFLKNLGLLGGLVAVLASGGRTRRTSPGDD